MKKEIEANEQTDMWTPRRTAEFVGFKSPITILRAFRRGELIGYKLNSRTIRFSPNHVKAWLEAGRVKLSSKGGSK